jgi:hypothetical protein
MMLPVWLRAAFISAVPGDSGQVRTKGEKEKITTGVFGRPLICFLALCVLWISAKSAAQSTYGRMIGGATDASGLHAEAQFAYAA